MTIASLVESAGVDWNIDEVPRRRFAPLTSDLICPVSDFRVGDVLALAQQLVDVGAGLIVQVSFCDQRHDLMPFSAPRQADGRAKEKRGPHRGLSKNSVVNGAVEGGHPCDHTPPRENTLKA
jgi:hypothetical protein